jgi:hypothetical protein
MQFNNPTQPNKTKKMKNLIRSINRSPLRCGFFTMAIALGCFALSPPLKAQDCPTECGAGGNTAVGDNALDSLTDGINNTAVGKSALTSNTTGGYNVGIGSGALRSNTTGLFNMAVGTEALRDNTANYNLAIGFRVLFINTTGRHLTGIGAGALLNNTTASFNTAIGSDALRDNDTGENNTAIGADALAENTNANGNTAVGFEALDANTNGSLNNAFGVNALGSNVGAVLGDMNNAFGANALASNVEGERNSAFGDNALQFCTGNRNTALGNEAGVAITTSSNNLAVGDNAMSTFGGDPSSFLGNTIVGGFSGNNITTGTRNVQLGSGVGFAAGNESDTIRIGRPPNLALPSARCFLGGVAGSVVLQQFVTIDPVTGQLFRFTSSARYKKDIKPMDKASESIFALKPVTFRGKNDPKGIPQFGLIAEEVAKVNPDLVSRDADGRPDSVGYLQINVMLLNEFLKEHKKVEELQSTVAQQQKGMEVLTAQLKEQAAQIQKVSAQLEASKPAPKVVNNNQ